ncbi:hypothetical protein [Pumilibacter intestinalis]|nr:hypothetical protein [Pumilibacter intestinalis]
MKEKETENSVSLSSGCSYTPVMVPPVGVFACGSWRSRYALG